MKVLVTGAAGQLGCELKKRSADWTYTDIDQVNIVSGEGLKNFEDVQFVINCSAYTAVDKAESDLETCRAVNALGPQVLAQFCDKIGARLIQISTDFVFDGQKSSPYLEIDAKAPLSVYGLTKSEGEDLSLMSGNNLVIRTSWLYNRTGANFVNTMIRLGKEKPELRIIADQIGTPTFAGDLAALIVDIVDNRSDIAAGVYHFSNEGVASWYDFAQEILDQVGIKTPVHPIGTQDYPTPARRPTFSVMSKEKIRSIMGNRPYFRHWKKALSECLNEK